MNKKTFIQRTLLGALITAGISAALFLAGVLYASSFVLIALGVFIASNVPADLADIFFATFIFLPIILVVIGVFSVFFKIFYYNYWRKRLGTASTRSRVITYASLNFLASILLILIISATVLFSYFALRSVQFRAESKQEDTVLSYTRENFDSLRTKMSQRRSVGEYPCVYIQMGNNIKEVSYSDYLNNRDIAVVCDFPITYKNARQFSTCFPSETHRCVPMKETADGALVE